MKRVAGSLEGQGVRVRGTIAPQFLARHALSPADAIPFAPMPAERRGFDRMLASGAIRQAGDGCWLDLRALAAADEAQRRRAVPLAIAGTLIVAALVLLFYRG